MAFKKAPKDNFSNEPIAGFWTRKNGEVITGKFLKLVDSDKVEWPFFLVKLTENGGTIIHDDKEMPATTGMVIGIIASKGLDPLNDLETGKLIRLTSEGQKEFIGKDPKTKRKTPMSYWDFTVEIDDGVPIS